MKTASLWGKPPSRFYQLLRRVEGSVNRRPLSLAVLGCSDGKFVLPAARRGYDVLAIDIDEVALFGGRKTGPEGEVEMPGLARRLELEDLVDRVTVVHADLVEHATDVEVDLVLTSGALQYSRNMKHRMSSMVECVKSLVRPGGYLYVDYMLPMNAEHIGRDNYPGRDVWQSYFSGDRPGEWAVLSNRVLPPLFEAAHVDLPIDHYHHWGHLLARRADASR